MTTQQISVKNTIGLKPYQSNIEDVIYLIQEMISFVNDENSRVKLGDYFALFQLPEKLRSLGWLSESDALLILRSYDFLSSSGFTTTRVF